MYAHRSTPSFSKVILRLFTGITIIFLLYFSYSTFAEHDPIKERLYQLGYPTENFIFTNNTIKWADGHLTIVQGAYVEDYPITAEQAYEIARNYLASYNKKLEKYNYKLYPDKKTLAEKEKDGQRYWVFGLKLDTGGSKLFAGFIWVNRKTGAVSVKGLLG
jgi:hypothetical protein